MSLNQNEYKMFENGFSKIAKAIEKGFEKLNKNLNEIKIKLEDLKSGGFD